MAPSGVRDASYEIRIRGRVSRALLDSFEGMASELEPAETVLHGPVRDQAELYGLIGIQALGLELVELRRLPGYVSPQLPWPPGSPGAGDGSARPDG
jgi:hypothetical protein